MIELIRRKIKLNQKIAHFKKCVKWLMTFFATPLFSSGVWGRLECIFYLEISSDGSDSGRVGASTSRKMGHDFSGPLSSEIVS